MSIPGIPGTKAKPLGLPGASSSPMPAMPGTDDDDLEVELTIAPPPPPLSDGEYEIRLTAIKPWKGDDGKVKKLIFEFELVCPLQEELMNRGEASNYGLQLAKWYDPYGDAGQQRFNAEFCAGLGYPVSSWPLRNGRPHLGLVLKTMRAELIHEAPHKSPRFLGKLKTVEGKGEKKGQLNTYLNTLRRCVTKPKGLAG